jgi:hypothetical protein
VAYRAAARAEWAPHEWAVFAAFESFGLRFWDAWPAYAAHLPAGMPAFKDPLTFAISEDWDNVFATLVHELCHLHEDHPTNRARYEALLTHIRQSFPHENEDVQCHLITCTLQRAVLMQAFRDRWPAMVDRAGRTGGHSDLVRAWQVIGERERRFDWYDPLTSLAALT